MNEQELFNQAVVMTTKWAVQQWINRQQSAARLAPWANDPEVSDQYRDAVVRCHTAFDDLVGCELVVRTRRIDEP